MQFPNQFIAAGASLLFLAAVFIPMEKAFPAKAGQGVFRSRWLVDTCYFFGQYLLFSGIVLNCLDYVNNSIENFLPLSFRTAVGAQPQWLAAIEVLVLSDMLIYWGHRLQHTNNFLWRFHKVHHSAETLDWLAAHREHPLDSIYTVALVNLPAMVLGFDLSVLSMVVAFRGIWAIYIHSNVRMPIGWLRLFIGAPELHHWHHDKERDRGNYANIFPLMDRIFGTYTCPDHEPESFGIHEQFATSYVGQMLQPILPDRVWKKISGAV